VTHGATAPLSVVVLTFNEERNLRACLESVNTWTSRVFVVDSGSTDSTRDIAVRSGAEVVVHPFESHAQQWAWALASLPLDTEWVLALDADQIVTPELRKSIVTALASWHEPGSPVGAYLNRRQVFRGRWIRHGGYYPKYLLKLFRRGAVRLDEGDLVDHHFAVNGPTATLEGDLVEDNRNEGEIAVWIDKHNRYAVRQAREEQARWVEGASTAPPARFFGSPDERTMWQKRLWNRLPLYIRPFGYFFYRYIIRLGFLDGKEGFIFHFMQAFWYRLLVDINRDELRARPAIASPIGRPPVPDIAARHPAE
jgi:glycosyltransferase involved in cell wall biosynthesis